jgi:hypothetical protein
LDEYKLSVRSSTASVEENGVKGERSKVKGFMTGEAELLGRSATSELRTTPLPRCFVASQTLTL